MSFTAAEILQHYIKSPTRTRLTLQREARNEIFTAFICNLTPRSRRRFNHQEQTGCGLRYGHSAGQREEDKRLLRDEEEAQSLLEVTLVKSVLLLSLN